MGKTAPGRELAQRGPPELAPRLPSGMHPHLYRQEQGLGLILSASQCSRGVSWAQEEGPCPAIPSDPRRGQAKPPV